MDRRNFLKISGLVLLSEAILSQTNKSNPKYKYIGNIKEDNPKFYDTYVAIPKFSDGRIVSSNKSPSIAKEEAGEKGFQNPLITYYPNPKEAQCPQVRS